MKISLNWLGDFIEWTETDPQEIARKVTAHTAEVDEVEQQGALMDHCCVGQILSVAKHPDADRLSVCELQTDKGKKGVVCGGTNLREGMRVAFAHVGATVRHGKELFTLSKVKIRGVSSEGMICAAEELELDEVYPPTPEQGNRPIIDLGDGDEGVGEPLREYLGMTDTVLHIDNHAITHRPDLFSHIGFARECVAMGIAKWKKQSDPMPPEFAKDKLGFKIVNDAGDLIPRYCACTMRIDSIGETPEWMKRRLEATGWRSVSLPVDITNYVTMELGMPLHSFDLGDLKGDIKMRTSKKGETITTLDEVERELPDGAIVLSDDDGIFDLLGIMGGLRSSTKDSTKTIFLHSAIVDPVSIRKAIIATGHRTDASTVYEKSVPRITAELGFYRALELFLELVPGATITSVMDTWGDNGTPKPIDISLPKANHKLGSDIPEKTMVKALEDLGCTVEGKGDVRSVTPPLWRMKDLEGEHDLVEEVGRIYGLDNIELSLPEADITPPERDHRANTMRDMFRVEGYLELVPFSFVSPDLLRRTKIDASNAAEVDNALGEELSLMQPSTLPRLLEHAEEYVRHAEGSLLTFTIANVFGAKEEHSELGLLYTAHESTDLKTDPFLQAKADIISVLGSAGFTPVFVPAKNTPDYAHPGRCADITVDDEVIGQLFEVHPAVRLTFDLPARASAALTNLSALLTHTSAVTVPDPLPQYPAVSYDVTVTLDANTQTADVLQKAKEASELLENIGVTDLYSGEPLTDGQYNVTFHCTYRSNERTLKEEEAKQEHEKVMDTLQ